MNKTDTTFVLMDLVISRDSGSTNLMGHYISEALENCGVWRITIYGNRD